MNIETKDQMTSINISLPFSMKEFIENEVSGEGYGTASEFVPELLRDAKSAKRQKGLQSYYLKHWTPRFSDDKARLARN